MLTRRTLTRGAVWTLPVVATAVAAPVLAASGVPAGMPTDGPASLAWPRFVWSPVASGRSTVTATAAITNTNGLANLSTQSITLLSVEAHTTYHAPAANTGQHKVATVPLTGPSWTLAPKGQTAFDVVFNNPDFGAVPPQDAGGNDLTRSYYSGTPDGKVPCVPSFVSSTDARYPYAGQRLTLDSAYLVLTYTAGSVTYAAVAAMSSAVKGRVSGSYCTT